MKIADGHHEIVCRTFDDKDDDGKAEIAEIMLDDDTFMISIGDKNHWFSYKEFDIAYKE